MTEIHKPTTVTAQTHDLIVTVRVGTDGNLRNHAALLAAVDEALEPFIEKHGGTVETDVIRRKKAA